MIHILDLLQTGPQDTWVIVGKGPSHIANWRPADSLKYCSINESMDLWGHRADLAICNDWWALPKIRKPATLTAIPTRPHDFPTDQFDRSFKSFTELFTALSHWSGALGFFDLRTTANKPLLTRPIVHAFNTSAESALILLAEAGVRNFYLTGIDGGVGGYHPSFGPARSGYHLDKAALRIAEIIERYNLNILKAE